MTTPIPNDANASRRVGWIDELRDWLRRINGNVLLRLGDTKAATRLSVRNSADAEIFGMDSMGGARARGVAARDAAAGLTTLAMPEAGNVVTLQNSWVHYDMSTYGSASYYRQPLGVTRLSGVIKSGTIGAAAFTLPEGYRPEYRFVFPTLNNTTLTRLDIHSTGSVVGYIGNTFVVLDGLEMCSTYPPFIAPTLLNSWVNYSSEFNPAGYYKDATGMVFVRGLVKSGSTYAVFTLPEGYRPPYPEVFCSVSNDAYARVDVYADGTVLTYGSATWASLDSIKFHTSDTVWTAPAFENSWLNYGGGWVPAGYYKDPYGVVRLRGLIASGTIGQTAFTLPEGYRPTVNLFLAASSNNAFSYVTIAADGRVIPSTGDNTWVSLSGLSFRAAV